MLTEEIKSVLSFAAFRPDVDDADIPWAKRFEGRKSLLINIGRSQTSWRAIDKKGVLVDGGVQEDEFADVAPQRADEWRGLTDGGWCAVSVNHRFIISLENNMMRGENCISLLRSNPRAVLGPKFDRGKRYAISHHPEAATSMLLAVEDSMIKVTEDILKSIGLRPARVCSGLFAMMEHTVMNLGAENRGSAPSSFVLIASCEGSIAALCQQDGQWKDFRCRSGLGQEMVETTLQIVSPLVAKAPPGTPVFYVSDGQDEKFRSELMVHLEKVGARDLTEPDLLWRVIGNLCKIKIECQLQSKLTDIFKTMSDYLCHDFKSPRADASRRLPSSFRFVPIAFYLAIVGGIYFVTVDIMSLRRAEQERVTSEQLRKEHEETKAKLAEEKLKVDVETAKAREVAKWVEGTRVLQPICVEAARAIQGEVKIAELALDRNAQLPSQIDVSMRLTGADASQITAVENAFGKLNYRPYSPQQARTQEMIDYRSTLVFGNE